MLKVCCNIGEGDTVVDSEPRLRLVSHQVPYVVDNPRYVELTDLVRSAELLAPTLWSSCDGASSCGPVAWSGGKADETFVRVNRVKDRARQAASNAVARVRAARDQVPATLTQYRTEWFWEWGVD